MSIYDLVLSTPVGKLGVVLAGERLVGVRYLPAATPDRAPGREPANEVVRQLRRYFARGDWCFDLPLDGAGTRYQRRVWDALCRIPAGSTRSYGALAREVGGGARAVGNACRANPCPIVVPCHRVVGQRGLGGYGGAIEGRNIEVKRWLLSHERTAAGT